VSPSPQNTFFDTVKSSLAKALFTADLKAGAAGSYDFGYASSTSPRMLPLADRTLAATSTTPNTPAQSPTSPSQPPTASGSSPPAATASAPPTAPPAASATPSPTQAPPCSTSPPPSSPPTTSRSKAQPTTRRKAATSSTAPPRSRISTLLLGARCSRFPAAISISAREPMAGRSALEGFRRTLVLGSRSLGMCSSRACLLFLTRRRARRGWGSRSSRSLGVEICGHLDDGRIR